MLKIIKRLPIFFKSLDFKEWLQLIGIILIIVLASIKLFEILFVGPTITKETPVGSYQCSGGLIKVCSGSEEVYDYLGV